MLKNSNNAIRGDMSNTYRVVIKGLKNGFTEEQVTVKLAALFKTNEEQARKILLSGGVPVKKGIDLQTAAKYQAAIEAAGASVVVEPEVQENAIEKYCTKCGSGISPDAEFCGKCGAKIGLIDTTTVPSKIQPSLSPPPQVAEQVSVKPSKRKIDINNLSIRDVLKATAIVLILGFMGAIFFDAPKNFGSNSNGIPLTSSSPELLLTGGAEAWISAKCEWKSGDWLLHCLVTNLWNDRVIQRGTFRIKGYDANGVKQDDLRISMDIGPGETIEATEPIRVDKTSKVVISFYYD